MTECRDKSLKQIQIFLRTVLINFWMFHELHLLTFIYRISDERHEDKQRWQTDRVSEQRRQWAGGVGNSAWVTAFIIKKPDRKGNGMIAPHHPSSSLFPPSLPRSSRSVCWPSIRLYLLRPVLCCPRSPFYYLSPPETYICPTGEAPSFVT